MSAVVKAEKKKNTSYYVNCVITLAIMLLFRLIPASGALTSTGVQILGIILGCLYGWCTVGLVWPSLFGLALFAFCGYANGDNAFSIVGSNRTTLYILILFFFSGMFVVTDTAPAIAQRIITLKIARGRPYMLTFLLLLAAYVPSIVIGGTTGTIIVWNLIYAVSAEAGYKKGDKWPMIMILSAVFVCTFGHNTLPFQVSNVGTFGALIAQDSAIALDYGRFLAVSVLYALIAIPLILLCIRFVIKPDVSKLKNYDNSKPVAPLRIEQKLTLWLFALVFVLLMLPSVLRGTAVGTFLNTVGNCGIVSFVCAIGLLVRHKDGTPMIDFGKIARETVPWPVMIMISTALALSGTFNSELTGINVWMRGIITPVFGNTSPLFFAILIIVACTILTNFLNNAVVSYLLVPVLYSFRGMLGDELMMATMFIIMLVNNYAFLFPSGSTSGALLAGQKEWLSTKQLFGYGSLLLLVSMIVALLMLGFGYIIM